MKYKAKAKGFDGTKVRERGEVFEYEGKKGSWMEPVEGSEAKALESKGKALKDKAKDGSAKSAGDEDVI